MRVVALNQFYRPSQVATAQLLSELCEGLARRGHEVTVVTAALGTTSAHEHGVDVVRVGATRLGKAKLWHRALDYGSFYASAVAAMARIPADVYLPLTTPPLIAVVAQLAALPRQTPVVSVVQDLYPDVAVALGAVPAHGLVHRAWEAATRLSLRASARVVALSDAMARRLGEYGVPPERLDLIPNWALGELDGVATGAEARLEYGLGERFVVMYSGNLGAGHTFDTLLAAARRLADRQDIVFAFVGEGLRRGEVEAAAQALPNIRLFPLAPRERLAESLAAGDLHVVTMRDGVEGLIVPSKLYGILGAARPVLFIGPRSDIGTIIDRAGAGSALHNGDVDGVVRVIREAAALPDRGRALGAAGRAHLEAELGRERALDRYEASLTRALGTAIQKRQPAQKPTSNVRSRP